MRTYKEKWHSAPREAAMREWWNELRHNDSWSGAIIGMEWGDLTDYQQTELWEIFNTHVHFGDT